MPLDDKDRLRHEYQERERHFEGTQKYGPQDVAYQFTMQQREAALTRLFKRQGIGSLAGLMLLDVGCGNGGILPQFLARGATPGRLHGTDLLPSRLKRAHERFPELLLTCSDGQQLPYATGTFDIVTQFTVFSSILDSGIRESMANEMLRVVKPDGLIIWYDFWLNPSNKQTQGIRPGEIRKLFRGARCDFSRITLAPPIVRLIAPRSRWLCAALERVRLLNSHYLAAIRHR